ncbi:MAG: 50S ribosomal protein L14 [Promethearchaeia archaeon]
MGTRRKTGRKRLVKPRTSYGVQNGSKIFITDNSGAKIGEILNVDHSKTRLRRLPKATVGDVVTVSIKKGKSELRGQIMKAVIVRQRRIYRRPDGTRLSFEDNAGVIIMGDGLGSPKGTEIRGPIAREAAELFPRIASISSLII